MTGNTPAEIVAKITEKEWEFLRLIPLGLTDIEISAVLFKAPDTVKTQLSRFRARIGVGQTGRPELADFYLKHMLALDVGGEPLMPGTPAFTEPGQKLADWTVWAEKQRALMEAEGTISPRELEALMLYVSPLHFHRGERGLAKLLLKSDGTSVSANTYRTHIRHIVSLAPHVPTVTRQWLLTVNRLAPLDVLVGD